MRKFFFIIQIAVVCVYANNITIQNYVDENQYLVSKKNIDINNDNRMDIVWLCLAKDRKMPNLLYIFIQEKKDTYTLLLKKELENFKARPYNGYSLNSNENKLLLNLVYPQDRGGDVEKYFFEIGYKNKHLYIKDIYYNKLNLCDFSSMENYKIKLDILQDTKIKTINFIDSFKIIEKEKFNSQYFSKIFSKDLEDEYNMLLSTFKAHKNNELKTYVESQIIKYSDLDDSKCSPENYMNKYFFEDNITYTNDIAHYLEKAGAYKESIYLLEKILEKYPNRTVAYINLGDAYLGDKQKDKAIEAYKIYRTNERNRKRKENTKKSFRMVWNKSI